MADTFEKTISELTQPLNGQFPRPWMTTLTDPRKADVFIVGRNQRNGYSERLITHARHMDALFNRNGETCKGLYTELTQNKSSPTRTNIERLSAELASKGVTNTLETNVICYSSPMSADLAKKHHQGGAKKGQEIFSFLLKAISPKFLIVHGAGATTDLARMLAISLPDAPHSADEIRVKPADDFHVIVMNSLAPPAFNKWSSWSQPHFENVASHVASHLG